MMTYGSENLLDWLQLMEALSTVLFIGTGIWLADTGRMDFSLVLLAFPLQSMVGNMVYSFGAAWNFIVTVGTAGEKVIDSLRWPQEKEAEIFGQSEDRKADASSKEGSGKPSDSVQNGNLLRISHVDFGYEQGNQVLSNISLEIEPGKKIALVGPSGSGKSSGGQRQRIAIAKAFLSNAPIVLLDEPTAALDVESEKLVQESLTLLMADRTVLMVAHRLETVRDFDEIIVLDQIVQRGTHGQLMEKEGVYSRLYQMQEKA